MKVKATYWQSSIVSIVVVIALIGPTMALRTGRTDRSRAYQPGEKRIARFEGERKS